MSLTIESPANPLPLDRLREQLVGTLHDVSDPAYAGLVTPWNLAVPMQPQAVVAARTAQDVVAAVRFAGAHGRTVGVQATGHGAVASLAGDLLVSTAGLDELSIDPTGVARVGAGVKWRRVIDAAAPHGLAPLNGSASDVGVVGYTTGGGVGPMARTFGIASDRVRAFEVVTGDGVLRRVTPTLNPELFFALRGGKGAVGIVTAVEFELLRMTSFYGGALYFDGADAAAVIQHWRHWSATLPEQATTSFALLQLPPLPEVPQPLAGRLTLAVRFVWTGDPQRGAQLLDELRATAPLLIDDVAVRPYTEVDSVHADPVDPMPVLDQGMLLSDFTADAAARLLELAGPGSDSPQVIVELRQLGGAYARPGAHPDAFAHRAAGYSLLAVGMAFDPTAGPHTRQLFAALAAWDTGGIWPNFGPAHDPHTARRAYDPPTLARLAAVARSYDPRGVLQTGRYLSTDLG